MGREAAEEEAERERPAVPCSEWVSPPPPEGEEGGLVGAAWWVWWW